MRLTNSLITPEGRFGQWLKVAVNRRTDRPGIVAGSVLSIGSMGISQRRRVGLWKGQEGFIERTYRHQEI